MSGILPDVPALFAHQAEGAAFEEAHPRLCDFSDPGTGKTRTRLEAFSRRRAKGGGRMLVLAPKSLLHSAWFADARRYTPWLTVSCAYSHNRQRAFEREADIYVTNHDAAKWLAKQPDAFFARFTDLVIDESGAFKHHTSQRSKAIAKIKRHFKRRVVMNGSPNTNSILDVWHQANIVDDGERLGKSFYAFRQAVCAPQQVGPQVNMVKWIDRPGAIEAVAAKLGDITLRYKLRDCLDIPDNFKYVVPFEMSAAHRAKYDEMEATAVLQLKSGVIDAVNAAAVVTKLLQIASGAVYDADGKYHVLDPDRYELVMDLAEERRHVVVFFNWVHQRDLLIAEAERRGMTYALIDGSVSSTKRREVVPQFQAGMYRVMFAHPASAAHGLTLTKGTRTIWASPTYNLEYWIQGNHRIDRAGQTEKTETANIIAESSIEGHVYRVLSEKNVNLADMLGYLTNAARHTSSGGS